MEVQNYWPQVATIVIANLTMFLWATRQARSDYLHMDKKAEDNRREINSMFEKHMKKTNFMFKNINNTRNKSCN